MEASPHDVTRLLRAWRNGEPNALEELMPLVYGDLHRLAQRHMAREAEGQTLQTTALVNEAYLRLVDSRNATWEDRAHFFAFCARLMRNILVDAARSRHAQKRGAHAIEVQLDEALAVPVEQPVDVAVLDEALTRLSAFDPRKSQVLELRIFGGLSVEETAEVLKISSDTVTRDMRMATAWIRRELTGEKPHGT